MEWFLYPPIYLAIKFAVYLGWCRLGIRLFAARENRPLRRSALLALLRIALGFLFGWLLIAAMMWAVPEQSRIGFKLPQYVFGLVLLRWIEWSAILVLLRRNNLLKLFAIRSSSDFLWRLGGVIVSFLTDIALIASVGAAGLIPC